MKSEVLGLRSCFFTMIWSKSFTSSNADNDSITNFNSPIYRFKYVYTGYVWTLKWKIKKLLSFNILRITMILWILFQASRHSSFSKCASLIYFKNTLKYIILKRHSKDKCRLVFPHYPMILFICLFYFIFERIADNNDKEIICKIKYAHRLPRIFI